MSTETDPKQDPKADDSKLPSSQDELNRIIAERVNRERAKFGDYDDLKRKAAEFDRLDEANKTEVQKAIDKAAQAEADAAAARTEALRLRVAAKHGISDEDADLFLTGSDEGTLIRQAVRLAEQTSTRKKQSNVVPGEGKTPPSGSNELREFTRNLFGRDT